MKTAPVLHLQNVDADPAPALDTWMTSSFIPLFLTLKGRVPVVRFSFYVGAGPSTCLSVQSVIDDSRQISGDEEDWVIEVTYANGWGFHGVCAAEFRITDRFSVHLEVRAEQLTFKTEKAVITSYMYNGDDRLSEAYPDVIDREVHLRKRSG